MEGKEGGNLILEWIFNSFVFQSVSEEDRKDCVSDEIGRWAVEGRFTAYSDAQSYSTEINGIYGRICWFNVF